MIEAVLADLAVRRYGLDFFIADAESPYEQTKKLHGWARSKTFVNALGTRGFSVFLADQATAADYAALEPLAAAASG